MKRRALLYTALLTLVGLVVFIGAAIPSAQAVNWGFYDAYLAGDYAVEFTGTVNFPSNVPFSVFNGPFAQNGLVSGDGQGNLKKKVIFNMNGQITRASLDATYHVNPDGTFTESMNFPLPPLPGFPPYVVMKFDGVLTNHGRDVKAMLTGITGPGGVSLGLPTDYIGMVVSGTMTRQ